MMASSSKKISIHSIQQLDPDAIFLLLHKEPKPLLLSKLKQQEAWQNLKAVTQQAVYPLASDPWREYTAASHQRVIQDLLSFFRKSPSLDRSLSMDKRTNDYYNL